MRPAPVGVDEFASLMASLGPFEASPRLAVAVSGGPDSMALATLSRDWAARRGGAAVALVVDHGLRPEAAKEARATAEILRREGLEARILTWRGAKPVSGLQEKARAARYGLLDGALRRLGSCHLLLGHHAEDQAETFLLRLGRGSGPDGLAAMAALVERPDYRLLRPLLTVPKARLKATLVARGLHWIEDPGNDDPRFTRVRLRRLLPELATAGLDVPALCRGAARMGAERDQLEEELAGLFARHARLDPRGWVSLDVTILAARRGRALVERLLLAIGGARYAPRRARIDALWDRLLAPGFVGATLGGCRVLARGGRIWVLREAGRCPPGPLHSGRPVLWDGRFRVTLGRRPGPWRGALSARCLGRQGWQTVKAQQSRDGAADPGNLRGVPAVARLVLPSLWDDQGLIAVPHLPWLRPGWSWRAVGQWEFQPRNPLTRGTFTVV